MVIPARVLHNWDFETRKVRFYILFFNGSLKNKAAKFCYHKDTIYDVTSKLIMAQNHLFN